MKYWKKDRKSWTWQTDGHPKSFLKKRFTRIERRKIKEDSKKEIKDELRSQ